MNDKKISSLLSMATKAGKTVSGEDTVLKDIRGGKAAVVIISREASDRSKKTFHDKCSFYEVPIFEWGTKEELGRYLGKVNRTVAAVTDLGFGEGIIKLFREES